MRPVRERVHRGEVSFLPIRGSQVTSLFEPGSIGVDVAMVHVSPPDQDGRCSLGVSVSYPLIAARVAQRVIAQMNPRMPRTGGDAFLDLSDIDMVVEVDAPLLEHRSPSIDDISSRIAQLVVELIPAGATLQTGIGSIPEAVLSTLAKAGYEGLRVYGMGTDGIVDVADAGSLLDRDERGAGVIAGELMGTSKLFEFVDGNPNVDMQPFPTLLDPARMALFEPFVSINSAVEIDLRGQVNAEFAGGTQISGVGGGFDFLIGSWMHPGNVSIIAMRSTNGSGQRSKIVPRLADGAPVSVPRHLVQYVVTEHGVANLAGLSLRQRAEALAAIADPGFRPGLEAAIRDMGAVDDA